MAIAQSPFGVSNLLPLTISLTGHGMIGLQLRQSLWELQYMILSMLISHLELTFIASRSQCVSLFLE